MASIVKKINLKRISALLLLQVLIPFMAHGKQIPTVTGILKTHASYTPNVTTGNSSASNTILVPAVTNTQDYNVQNTISLKYDLNTDTFFLAPAHVRVKVTINRWDANNIALTTISRKLSVHINNKLNRAILEQSSVNLINGYKIAMTIDSIWINGASVKTLPRYVSVESEINMDRYYDFSSAANTTPINTQILASDKDCDGTTDELQVSWSVPTAVPEEYQLEWTYVSNYSQSGGNYPASAFITNFKNNSTRITTTANSYKVSLIYPDGYLAFRVRAVGRDYLNPSKFIYGPWNVADNVNIGSLSSDYRYTIAGHEEIKNWQYSGSYAEEGKKKEVITYFDGSLRNRQTVTKINSDKNVIVGETIYDFQGRPALNILPVPVNFTCVTVGAEPTVKYYTKFNVDDTNKVYSKNDFDLDASGACLPGAAPMDTASGASLYYSNNNPNKTLQQSYLPHAKEYPFSQLEYTPDNTGRVRNQSGLGKDYRLGSGKETKYLYGQPNQIQVDRLFGSEAGDASHYKKNVTIDANGQTSLTYLNQEGKTIATALAGVPPTIGASTVTRLDSLNYAAQNQSSYTIDLFNKNALGASNLNTIPASRDQLNFSTQLLVPFRSTFDFRYTLDAPILSDACLKAGVCVSCIYDLEIQVKDECGVDLIPTVSPFTPAKRVTGNVSVNGTQLTFNTNCSVPLLKDSVKVSLTLNPGVYTVNKILKVNSQARDYYVKKYTDSVYNSCVQTLHQFKAVEMTGLDTLDCYVSCVSCATALGTRDDYVASGKGTAEQWDFLIDKCNEPCRQKTLCQVTYDMMLSDVSPGGQYAKFNQGTFDASNEPLSVLNEQNTLKPNSIPGHQANWRKPRLNLNGTIHNIYLDENGVRTKVLLSTANAAVASYQPPVNNPALVFVDNVTGLKCTYPENLLNLSDFIAIWESSYARSLVTFHPEYAYYVSCTEHSIKYPNDDHSSDGLDSLLFVTETFAQAVSAGFILPGYNFSAPALSKIQPIWMTNSPGTPYDPFFTNTTFQYLIATNPNTGSKTNLNMSLNLQAEMNNIINNYNAGYTMADVAAYLARCGNNFGTAPPSPSCLDFGMDITTPPTNPMNDTVRNNEWRIFKQLYYAEKQKLQWQRMDFYARHGDDAYTNYYGGCNACIGNSGFNIFSSGMVKLNSSGAPHPYPWSIFFDLSQPCAQGSHTDYAGAVKRFYDPANTGLNTNIGPALYQTTGQCPITFQLQNFLHAMTSQNLLVTGSYPINAIPEFGPDLYAALFGGTPPPNYVNHTWQVASVSGNNFTAHLLDPSSTVNCAITLNKPGFIPSFGNINGISQLVFDTNGGGNGAFKAVATYVVSGATLSANITGNASCMDIKQCSFDSECIPNQFATDIMNLFSYMQSTGQLTSGNQVIIYNDTTISKFVTPSILGFVNGNPSISYQFISPDKLMLYDSNTPSTKLIFTYTVTPSAQAANIKTFANIKSYYSTNLYSMDGLDLNGQVIASISGVATKASGTGTAVVTETLVLGSCGLPDPPECSQKEHKVRKDLETMLNEILVTKTFSNNINLYNLTNFSPLLRSYVSPTVNATASSFTTNGSTPPVVDSLVIKFGGTWALANNDCPLGLYTNALALNHVKTTFGISSVTDLTGIGVPDLAGNYYNFRALVHFPFSAQIVTDTIFGYSCWPIKNCVPCKNPSAGPINTYTFSTAFNRTTNTPYNGSNDGNFDPWWQVIETRPVNAYGAYTGPPTSVSQLAYDIAFSTPPFVNVGYINYFSTDQSGTSPISTTYKTTFTLPNPLPTLSTYSLSIEGRSDDAIARIKVNGVTYFQGLSGSAYGGPAAGAAVYIPGLVPGLNTIEIESMDLGVIVFGMAAKVLLTEYHNRPCDNGPPDSTFVFPPYTNYDNPCVKQKINLAYQNAALKYQQYIDNIVTTFADAYTKHCLSALERFTYKYVDKEYHHTLYYYDQAGNLIKTVPPEGVEYLPITAYTDVLAQKINSDRTNAQQTVYTNHRMATKYTYNSLNQLIYQSLPDHNTMDVCNGLNPNGLDTGLTVNAIQFLNANKGYLCGHIKRPGFFNRGYVYTTNDGGNSWTKVNGVSSGDLQKIQFTSSTNGYAVSTFGMVFKTTNGGNNWDLLTGLYTPLSGPRYVNILNDLHFNGNFGVVGGVMEAGASSAIFYTNNGGGTWSPATITPPLVVGDTITGITFDGTTTYIASSKNGLTGKIFSSTNGTSWTQVNVAANNLTRVQYISNSLAYAIGDEGTLMKLNAPITTNPVFQLVPTGMLGKFIDVYFKNATDGVAIIDSVLDKGKIFKTFNGGVTWQQLSANGEYYNSLQLYDGTNHKLIAGGKKGLLAKVLLGSSPFGITKITTPNAREVSFADMYDPGNNNVSAVAVGKNATLYTCYDAQVASPSWYSVNTFPTIPAADTIFKKVVLQASAPASPNLRGILLTTSGKLYSFYRTFNSSILFSPVTLAGTFFNDITTNDQSFAPGLIYAFDTISKKNYQISFSGTSASGTQLNNAVTGNINAIDIINSGNRMIMVGNSGHIEYTSNISSTTTWVNVTLNTVPVAVTRVKAITTTNFIATGIDGAIWKNSGSASNWYLKNSGRIDKLNSVAVDNAGNGLICADKGKLFRLTNAHTQQPTLVNASSGITANLTDAAVEPGGTKAYITANNGQVLYTTNYLSTNPSLASQVSPFSANGVAYKPSGNAVVVGNNVLMANYFASNAMVNNELYTKGLNSIHFFDANNGFVIDSNHVIRKTTDGGNTWSVIVPVVGTQLLTKVFAKDANTAIIIGLNRFAGVINGMVLGSLNASSVLAGTHFYDINYNSTRTFGFIVGSSSRVARINGTTNAITYLAQAVATSPPDFRTVHVFRSNSFIAAGTKGAVYYYKGVSFIQQTNFTGPAGLAKTAITLKDIYFHDDYTGYMVGSNGAAYRVSLSDSIGNLGVTANALPWNSFCTSAINMNYSTNTQIRKLDFNTIGFASRTNLMIGGADSNSIIGGFTPNRYARLLKEEAGYYSTRFWYDKLGRMVLSQNTKQFNKSNPADPLVKQAFSYTLYDALGRITEVGEKYENHTMGSPKMTGIFGSFVAYHYNNNAIDDTKLQAWISSTGSRREVTKTYYDIQSILPGGYTQNNLRKRVASTTYEDVHDGNNLTYNHATHYSYDIHGNVSTLWQENKQVGVAGQNLKQIDYQYDLISGKVNKVTCSPGQPDQLMHRYSYDADNRITMVETSTNGLHYDLDAKYFYYAHGPLARVEYGKNQVQGIDYAYTLQGWIKGVNSNVLKKAKDIGSDGDLSFSNPNGNFARDITGYSLSYFKGDYEAINYVKWNNANNRFESYTTGSDLLTNSNGLFNGNISSMVTTISKIDTNASGVVTGSKAFPLGNSYRYDQLNRLKRSFSYTNLDTTTNAWLTSSASAGLYRNTFSYDANGNIKTQVKRDSIGGLIDSLVYNYETLNGKMLRNRLYHVDDHVTTTPANFGDIKDQGTFTSGALINNSNNYSFDEIGNLIKDNAEQIDTIRWTVYGKIKAIIRSTSSTKDNLFFDYDATGNRIAKHVYSSANVWKSSTYYLRDAQGNVMSVYNKKIISSAMSYKLAEQHLYGSSRLGMTNSSFEMIGATPPPDTVKYYLGLKQYELSNHLGNVLSVISDKKIAVANTTTPTLIDYYLADMKSATDYYPGGSPMPGRQYNNGSYRYGMNGQEKTDEISGTGNHNTALFWEYDTRLGRRWNLDPKPNSSVSNYACFYNNPIWNTDVLGDKPTPKQAAAMAAHVYGDKSDKILKGGWKVSSKDFGIEKNNSENGLHSQVYERTKRGKTEYVYATAGTEDMTDAKQDALQPLGLSGQYDQSMNNATKISDKLGKGTELTFTGHSLGGGEAAANAYVTGRDAITFNAAGVSPLTAMRNSSSKVDAYIMLTDPLNAAQNSSSYDVLPNVDGTRHYVIPKDLPSIYNGHSMNNMLKSFEINPSLYQKPQ